MMTEKFTTVYLIGAGPGNTYLITVRAQNLLRRADVIIYDYLANDILLELTSPTAEKIYCGKHCGKHTLEQDEINALMYENACEGKLVVRLKGGDPFVFGRGGEEAKFLRKKNVPFEVVPGVTAATAALAYAGIPLTHRGLASSATIVTGHEDPNKENPDINWEALAQITGTLVFFMGVRRLPDIANKLVKHGKPKETPAALVMSGTTPRQKTVTGTLETIAEKVARAGLGPPAIIVVGDVVRLRETLQWYESLPLFGKTIMITRSPHQSEQLSERLTVLGAEVIHRPTIEIRPPAEYGEFDNCLQRGGKFDWIIFTSANAVRSFAERLNHLDLDIRHFHKARFAGIGSASREAIRDLGVRVDFVPEKFTSEGFIREFRQCHPDLTGMKILFPAANIARSVIPEKLSSLGAEVTSVTAYETAALRHPPEEMLSLFTRHEVHLVTFTSSSTAVNFMAHFPEKDRATLVSSLRAASIGPMTSKTLRGYGIEPVIESEIHNVPALVDAIVDYYRSA